MAWKWSKWLISGSKALFVGLFYPKVPGKWISGKWGPKNGLFQASINKLYSRPENGQNYFFWNGTDSNLKVTKIAFVSASFTHFNAFWFWLFLHGQKSIKRFTSPDSKVYLVKKPQNLRFLTKISHNSSNMDLNGLKVVKMAYFGLKSPICGSILP